MFKRVLLTLLSFGIVVGFAAPVVATNVDVAERTKSEAEQPEAEEKEIGRKELYPDNDKILAAIIDSGSPYYYPSLMLRYEAGDTTLTLRDYHHLYYGFAWQHNYNPLEPEPAKERVLMAFEQVMNEGDFTVEAAERLVRCCKEVMVSDPFSPSNLNFLTFAYGLLKDTVQERVNADRMKKVLKTIELSGTGLTEKEPWQIIVFTHANDFLASKDEVVQRRVVRSRTVEFIHLERHGREKAKGYFFDYGRIYWKKPRVIPERKKQGFKINDIEVGRRRGKYNPTK